MAEITELIKQKIDIIEFIGRYVKLKKSGRNFSGNCPFHQEKTPSFFVSPERQSWHCFGCNKGGDVFTFFMEKEGLDFKNALTLLAQETNTPLPTSHDQVKDNSTRTYEACEEAAHYFKSLLIKDKNGHAYIYLTEKRKVSPSMIEKFNLGYSPDSWSQTGEYLIRQGFKVKELIDSGLIIRKDSSTQPRDWYDRFRNRLIFPITNPLGKVVGFSARTLNPSEPGAKYINSPETFIFKKSELLFGFSIAKETIYKKNYAIIVEGQLDVISLHQIGIENVVAPQGSAFTENQADILRRLTSRLVLLFDNDSAGKNATLRSLEIALKKGFEVKIAALTNSKDPDEAAHTNPTQLKQDLKNTQDFFTFLLEFHPNLLDSNNPQGSAQISSFILPFIQAIPNAVQQETLINKLAEKLNVSTSSILQEFKKHLPRGSKNNPMAVPSQTQNEKKSRDVYLWQELVAMILQLPESLERDAQVVDILKPLNEIPAPQSLAPVLKQILPMMLNHAKITHPEIDANLDPEQLRIIDQLALKNLGAITSDEENYLTNLEILCKDIEISYIKKMIREIAQQDNPEKTSQIKNYTHRLKELTD